MSQTVQEPLRDRVGRAIYEQPGTGSNWYDLSEERREPWRQDADRAISVMIAEIHGGPPKQASDMVRQEGSAEPRHHVPT